jgi:Zn/Cd-binding protein ZinT
MNSTTILRNISILLFLSLIVFSGCGGSNDDTPASTSDVPVDQSRSLSQYNGSWESQTLHFIRPEMDVFYDGVAKDLSKKTGQTETKEDIKNFILKMFQSSWGGMEISENTVTYYVHRIKM